MPTPFVPEAAGFRRGAGMESSDDEEDDMPTEVAMKEGALDTEEFNRRHPERIVDNGLPLVGAVPVPTANAVPYDAPSMVSGNSGGSGPDYQQRQPPPAHYYGGPGPGPGVWPQPSRAHFGQPYPPQNYTYGATPPTPGGVGFGGFPPSSPPPPPPPPALPGTPQSQPNYYNNVPSGRDSVQGSLQASVQGSVQKYVQASGQNEPNQAVRVGTIVTAPYKASGNASASLPNGNDAGSNGKLWRYIGLGAGILVLAAVLGGTLGVVMSKKSSSDPSLVPRTTSSPTTARVATPSPTMIITEEPTSSPVTPTPVPTPKPTESFGRPIENGASLRAAVDNYLLDPTGGLTAEDYGHPIGNWNVSLVTDFSNVFDATRLFNSESATFNEDISRWDGACGTDPFVRRATVILCVLYLRIESSCFFFFLWSLIYGYLSCVVFYFFTVSRGENFFFMFRNASLFNQGTCKREIQSSRH